MLNLLLFCKVNKMSLSFGLKFTAYMCYCFSVCPVPMNKEEEEYIKERERNRELMEEIAREIEMTCLGKLKWLTYNNNNNNLGWASLSAWIAGHFE